MMSLQVIQAYLWTVGVTGTVLFIFGLIAVLATRGSKRESSGYNQKVRNENILVNSDNVRSVHAHRKVVSLQSRRSHNRRG